MSDPVGFIGLGVMGRPMAKHVQAKGHPLVVFSRSRPPVDELVRPGRARGASPADVARQRDDRHHDAAGYAARRARARRSRWRVAGSRAGAIVIDMSSISPVATRRLAAKVAAAGGDDARRAGERRRDRGDQARRSRSWSAATPRRSKACAVLACMGSPERIVHVGDEPAPVRSARSAIRSRLAARWPA